MKFDFKKNLPYIAILLIGVGGLCFGGYEVYKASKGKATNQNQEAQANNFGNGGGQQGGRQWGGQGGGGMRGNFSRLHGTVTSVSSDTIVMKADDGSSKNISVSSDTRIMEMNSGQRQTLAITDVKSGDEINVMASDTSQSTISPGMVIIGTFSTPQRGQGGGSGGYYQQSDPSSSSSSSQAI